MLCSGFNLKGFLLNKNTPFKLRSFPKWVPWVSLAWAVFVLVFFVARLPVEPKYWTGLLNLVHVGSRPSSSEVMRRLGLLLGSLGCGLWALWMTLRVGRLVGRVFGMPPMNTWLRTALESVMGIFALQLFWLGTGFLRLWRPPFLMGVAIAGTAYFLLNRVSVSDAPEEEREDFPFLERVWWIGALVISGFVFALSVLPENFYDSMAYILAVPQQWLRAGGVTDDPGQVYSGFNLGGSLWYTTALAWGGAEAARTMASAVTPLAALWVGGWVREESGKRSGRVAAALTLSFLLLALNGLAARSDGLLALTVVAGFYALGRSGEGESHGHFWVTLGGMALGLAFSMKYIAVVAVPVIFLYWFLLPIRPRVSKALAFLCGGGLMVLPWALKNYVFSGNPFYPYLPHLFGGRFLPEAGYARLLWENHLTNVSWWSWPPVPWALCQPGYSVTQGVGPLLLMGLPVFFLFRSNLSRTRWVPWACLLYFMAGFSVGPVMRFLMAGVLLLFVCIGVAWPAAPKAWTRTFAFLCILSTAASGLWMLDVVARRFDPLGVVLLRESREAYSERVNQNPYGFLTAWAGAAVPPDGKLLLVGDGRALGYPCRVLWNSVDDEAYLAASAREDKDAEALMRRFKRDGITQVAFNMPEAFQTAPDYHHYELTEDQWRTLDANLRVCLTPVFSGGGKFLFSVSQGLPGPSFKGVEPLAYLSPPALAARKAQERGDRVELQRFSRMAAEWFPQDEFLVEKKGKP
jgi:hypothetical protein